MVDGKLVNELIYIKGTSLIAAENNLWPERLEIKEFSPEIEGG